MTRALILNSDNFWLTILSMTLIYYLLSKWLLACYQNNIVHLYDGLRRRWQGMSMKYNVNIKRYNFQWQSVCILKTYLQSDEMMKSRVVSDPETLTKILLIDCFLIHQGCLWNFWKNLTIHNFMVYRMVGVFREYITG